MAQVTVIVPTYNRAHYLCGSLDSIFRQTWRDFEVIVVDDGSTDDTAEVIRGYPHPVRYIYQKNQGDAGARNRGLAETRTPLVAFLDSDDLWLPEKLERQTALLAGHDERTLVYCPQLAIDAEGRPVEREVRRIYTGRITTELFEHSIVAPIAILTPTELIRSVAFDTRYRVCSDIKAFLILSLTCNFQAIQEPLVMHRRHAANLSERSLANQRTKATVLEEFYFELGGREAIPRPRAMRRLSQEWRKAADAARQLGDRATAVELARKALGYQVTPRAVWAWLAALSGRR
jgi:glycosyltransferase involved in cell wall biosynthesis